MSEVSKPQSEPPVMATDFAIVVSGLGLVGDGYDDERGAALHRIRDRMASLEEQLESAQTALRDLVEWADDQQAATGAEMVTSLMLRLERGRAALASNPASRPEPPSVLPDPDIDLSTGRKLTGKRRGSKEQST